MPGSLRASRLVGVIASAPILLLGCAPSEPESQVAPAEPRASQVTAGRTQGVTSEPQASTVTANSSACPRGSRRRRGICAHRRQRTDGETGQGLHRGRRPEQVARPTQRLHLQDRALRLSYPHEGCRVRGQRRYRSRRLHRGLPRCRRSTGQSPVHPRYSNPADWGASTTTSRVQSCCASPAI